MKFNTATALLLTVGMTQAWKLVTDGGKIWTGSRNKQCFTVERERSSDADSRYFNWDREFRDQDYRGEDARSCCLVLWNDKGCSAGSRSQKICKREHAGDADFRIKGFEVTDCQSGGGGGPNPGQCINGRDRDGRPCGGGWSNPPPPQQCINGRDRDGRPCGGWSQPAPECRNGRDSYGRLCECRNQRGEIVRC